jgi:hypothetical protein
MRGRPLAERIAALDTATDAQANALLLDGSVQDLACIRKLDFPVIARGPRLRGAGKSGWCRRCRHILWSVSPYGPRAGSSSSGHKRPIRFSSSGGAQQKEEALMDELRKGGATMELEGKFTRD